MSEKKETNVEKIEKLHQLKEKGILTDKEFSEQKKQILGIKDAVEVKNTTKSEKDEDTPSFFSSYKIWLIILSICLLISIPLLLTARLGQGFTDVAGIGVFFLMCSILGFIAIGIMGILSLLSKKFGKEIVGGVVLILGGICFIANNAKSPIFEVDKNPSICNQVLKSQYGITANFKPLRHCPNATKPPLYVADTRKYGYISCMPLDMPKNDIPESAKIAGKKVLGIDVDAPMAVINQEPMFAMMYEVLNAMSDKEFAEHCKEQSQKK